MLDNFFNRNKNKKKNKDKDKNKGKTTKQKLILNIIPLIFILILMLIQCYGYLSYINFNIKKPQDISYENFINMVNKKQVKEVDLNFSSAKFEFKDIKDKEYITDNPRTDNFKEYLLKHNVKVEEISNNQENKYSYIYMILLLLVQIGLPIYLVYFIVKKSKIGSNDQSKIIVKVPDINFNDIAGYNNLKEEIKPILDYLKNPQKYIEMGARMPKGVVLYGPPGTGKTLMAKAIAGYANVPFFSVSGSDFVELWAGMGARRVRKLYREAHQHAPCIVFIDEIDSVGSNRGNLSSDSEKKQTINALLNELDGFKGSEGIITFCATNRIEDLDPALIRPGRFDKQLAVPLPDKDDRIQILQKHAISKKMDNNINYDIISAMTFGFSGAALESLINEAALITVKNNEKSISMKNIEQAFYIMTMKGNKKDNQSSDRLELKIRAYHEAGHALATKLYTNDRVPKITVCAFTSGAGGATFHLPKEHNLYSKKYIEGIIKMMYAGRAAERILTKSEDLITTGASNDIEQATNIIKEYISIFGMNEKIGLICVNKLVSQTSSENIVMEEAIKLSNTLYGEVLNDLSKYEDTIKDIANKLIDKETIEEAEFNAIIEKHNIPKRDEIIEKI